MPFEISPEAILWATFALFWFLLAVLIYITWPRLDAGLPIPATDLDGELRELQQSPHAWSGADH